MGSRDDGLWDRGCLSGFFPLFFFLTVWLWLFFCTDFRVRQGLLICDGLRILGGKWTVCLCW
jgi:hypothetical protein